MGNPYSYSFTQGIKSVCEVCFTPLSEEAEVTGHVLIQRTRDPTYIPYEEKHVTCNASSCATAVQVELALRRGESANG